MIRTEGLPSALADELRAAVSGRFAEEGWRKATASGPAGGNCLEVRALPYGYTALRNGTQPNDIVLFLTEAEWNAFKAGVLHGEF